MKMMIWNVRWISNKTTQQQVNYLRMVDGLECFAILEPMVALDEVKYKKVV